MPGRTPSWSQAISTTGRWCLSASRPATMPITPGCQPRSARTKAASSAAIELLLDLLGRRQLNASLQGLPRGVELVDVLGQFQRPLGPVRHQQFDGQLRLTEPAGGIEPRGQHERNVFAVPAALSPPGRARLDLGDVHERGHAERRALGQALQAVMHQDAIFVDQGHNVGHRPHGRQTHRPAAGSRASAARPFARRGLLTHGPRQLEGHPRAAQAAKRIRTAGQPRMHDGRGVGQTARQAHGDR